MRFLENLKVNNKLKLLPIVAFTILLCTTLIILIVSEISYQSKDNIPVLMYHSVGSSRTSDIVLPKEVFEEQLKYLKDNGYTTLTLDELYENLHNKKKFPKKSVVLTFDDGYKDNYEVIYPLLKSYGFKGTIFVQTNKVNVDNFFLTSQQIKDLSDNGVEIGSHTISHPDLSKLSKDEQYKELSESKKFLENILGKEVKYIAYPYGSCNTETKEISKKIGYTMAIGILDKYTDKSSDPFELSRRAVIKDMDNFKGKVAKNRYFMFKYKVRKLGRIINHKIFS